MILGFIIIISLIIILSTIFLFLSKRTDEKFRKLAKDLNCEFNRDVVSENWIKSFVSKRYREIRGQYKGHSIEVLERAPYLSGGDDLNTRYLINVDGENIWGKNKTYKMFGSPSPSSFTIKSIIDTYIDRKD